MTAVVEAESLTKRFGEVSAVTDLSFALEAGTITGFLGPRPEPRSDDGQTIKCATRAYAEF
jgi:ABC-type branched-subunit amino acid transport system ATPase component